MSAVVAPARSATRATPALEQRRIRAAEARADLRAGVAVMAPVVLAYVPFALVIGTVLAEHGGLAVGVAGTALIFGGSAHVATVQTLEEAGLLMAILTGLLVNARVLLYSAALARRWREQPRRFRLLAAVFLVDVTWVASERLSADCADPERLRRRFLAAAFTLGAGFTSSVAVGIVAAGGLAVSGLGIALPLGLIGLVGGSVVERTNRRVVVVAAIVAAVTARWPSGTGLLVATLAGCLAGSPRTKGES